MKCGHLSDLESQLKDGCRKCGHNKKENKRNRTMAISGSTLLTIALIIGAVGFLTLVLFF